MLITRTLVRQFWTEGSKRNGSWFLENCISCLPVGKRALTCFSSFLFSHLYLSHLLFISFGCYAGSPRRPVQINSLAEEFPPLPAQHAVGIADILRAVSPKLPSGKVKMNNFLSLLLKKHSLAPPPPAHAVHPTVLLTCAAMIMSQIPAREYAVVCKVDIYISFFLLVLTYAIKPICTFLHLKILQCRTSIAFWKATR